MQTRCNGEMILGELTQVDHLFESPSSMKEAKREYKVFAVIPSLLKNWILYIVYATLDLSLIHI